VLAKITDKAGAASLDDQTKGKQRHGWTALDTNKIIYLITIMDNY